MPLVSAHRVRRSWHSSRGSVAVNSTRHWLAQAVAGCMLLALIACGNQSSPVTPPPANDTNPPPFQGEIITTSDGVRLGVEVVAGNLVVPWSLVFAPDGRLFVGERPGRVRIITNGQLAADPALTLTDVAAIGEGGLLGMTLHPDFARTHLVYLVYTAQSGNTRVNRLVRFREVDGRLGEPAVLIDNIPAGNIHNGSRVRFGPDGRLYMTMGDVASSSVAQDLASLNGKILRLEEDGTPARDNPFSSPVFSLGHRNPQGIDWHPDSNELWETEHGQTGNDEINRIVAGANYGWPVIEGAETRPGMETPVLFFSPSIAPSGTSFYRGTAIGAFRSNMFVATLRGQHLLRVRFDPANPRRIVGTERLLEARFGRLRDVVSGPDGALYVSTSNRDGNGSPAADDDRIVRLVFLR